MGGGVGEKFKGTCPCCHVTGKTQAISKLVNKKYGKLTKV